ncbi:MAG: PQQ-dependent sugar dehydrogenase [Gemmatimonadaceae bacterium]
MRVTRRIIIGAALLGPCTLPVACSDASAVEEQSPPAVASLRLELVASGLANPLYLTAPNGDARLFIVEQPGRVRIVQNGQLLPAPFLDISSKVSSGGERGLLSVAFHPRYAQNGLLYVNYTDTRGDTRVERYHVSANANLADASSAALVITVAQPFANHNGGLVLFGPDGMLYIGMGDGGSGGDPQGNGQNPQALLGKMLRLDVDGGDPYAIPAGNPYASSGAGRREIWASGLRNPWRFAFDAQAGLLYIADVGQNRWEEVSVVPAASAGLNYGWNRTEGNHCYSTDACDMTGLVPAAAEYSHDDGCSITGGFVYRGQQMPGLVGHYFYSDYCTGFVRSFRYANGRVNDARDWSLSGAGNVLSFGLDSAGELYLLSADGRVSRIVAGS